MIIFIVDLVNEFLIMLLINHFFKLRNNKIEICFAFIVSIVPSIFYRFFELDLLYLFLLKLFDYFVVTLLLTNNFEKEKICSIYFSFIFTMLLSVGFFVFINSIFYNSFLIFSKKYAIFYIFLIIIAFFLFYFLIYYFIENNNKQKIIHNFLFKVSFLFCGSHIKINGLIDSGNSLYDTKTGLPVIVVCFEDIKQFFDENFCKNFYLMKYDEMKFIGFVNCILVGGKKIVIPVFNIGVIKLEQDNIQKKYECELGITNEKFIDNKFFKCLLHKDFL